MDSTALWVALGSAALAAVLLVLTAFALIRLLRPNDERWEDAPTPPETPAERGAPDEPGHDLQRAFERAQEETRRARRLALLSGTLDLQELLAQILEAATSACVADAAAVALHGDGAEPGHTKTYNLGADEVPPSLDTLRNESRARALAIQYRYPQAERQRADPIRTGLVVPLAGEHAPVGILAVYWRGEGHEPTDEELTALEEFAQSSGRAIENARRFQEASQRAVLDATTGLYNRRYFYETLAREIVRAHRYDRTLALLVFDIDDLKAINDRFGHVAGDKVLADVAERLRKVTRGSDIACRYAGDEFAVIMPESAQIDAEQLYQRLQLSLGVERVGPVEELGISAGAAELQRGDDATALFERADQQLLRAKRGGKGRVYSPEEELE